MSRKSKRQLALTHNCRHVVEFSAEPGNLKTIIQMISLLLAAKSLLWLAMIFPTLEFLISRCEHQFDVHQSPPAKVHRHTAIETHPVPARLADVLGLFVDKFGFPLSCIYSDNYTQF